VLYVQKTRFHVKLWTFFLLTYRINVMRFMLFSYIFYTILLYSILQIYRIVLRSFVRARH